MQESDRSAADMRLSEQLARHLDAIRAEDTPERLLELAQKLQQLLRQKQNAD